MVSIIKQFNSYIHLHLLILLTVVCLFSKPLYSQTTCAHLFNQYSNENSTYRFNKAEYSSIDKISKELARSDSIYWNAINHWSFKIPYNSRKSLFRGISLDHYDQISSLLKNGFSSKDSAFKKLFFDTTPHAALSYAFKPNNGSLREGISVLFEFNRKLTPTSESANGFRVTRKDVVAQAIERIYVFNKFKDPLFPFDIFTREEFLNLTKNDPFEL